MTNRTPAPHAGRHTSQATVIAAVLTGVEGLVLLGFAAFYAYEISIGATDSVTRALTSGLLILVFGFLLLFMARGWGRRATWPRTPTLLWNALLLPVAWSMFDAGQVAIALGVGALAIASIAAAVASPTREQARADADDGD